MNKGIDLVVAVLLNYDQNDFTVNCVKSLLDSNYRNLKIFLIDNGSKIENQKILSEQLPKHTNLIVEFLSQNIGYAKGSNYGLELARKLNPKYFLILNNDTIIDNEAVTELVNTSKEYHDMARVTGKVYHFDDPNRLQDIGYVLKEKSILSYEIIGLDELDIGQYEETLERDMIDDVFVLHPTSLYDKIGGYNTFLWVNGVNVEISLRAKKSGYKLIYTPKAKLWHKGSVSLGGRDLNPKMAFWNIQSKLILNYLFLNKIQFSKFYLRILINIGRTKLKSYYFKIKNDIDLKDYANAKIKALEYFHRWVKIKNENDGFNPF